MSDGTTERACYKICDGTTERACYQFRDCVLRARKRDQALARRPTIQA
jgi:hypothetical protein